jgi:photosystem II stability/assembly factor-like uncharacterized protein
MGQRLWVGTRKGLFMLEPKGSRWEISRALFLGDHVPMLLPDPRDGAIYAALDHGHFGSKLHRSADGGATWEEIGVPVYPEPAPGEVDIQPGRGTPIPWRLEKIWALEPGHANRPGVLWCGTIPGGLFRSEDGGRSWSLIEALWRHPKRKMWFGGGADLPGIHSVCVDPRDARRVAVGVSCGGVWMTADAGDSWECRASGMYAAYMPPERKDDPNIQDAHRVVQCRREPDCFWVQHHNGIFRTTDGGASWHDVPAAVPSTFGFAVAVHPNDPDTAWFVPSTSDQKRIPVDGRVVVSRTRDGGRTFDVLTEGLPQTHAYDITFRHALDVDGRGECLAFGSTTGSLWISTNQGDSWMCASQHLPPIYCVRFAA